jgi:hypothetical protein
MTDPYLKSIYGLRDDATETIQKQVLTAEQKKMFKDK